MEKNWYILYARSGSEKRVAASLEKRDIEYYLPLCWKYEKRSSLLKAFQYPLFEGYIFVYTKASEVHETQRSVGAAGAIYWKDKLVIVPEEEITLIRDFLSLHKSITVEEIGITESNLKSTQQFPISFDNNRIPFQISDSAKVILPSLGYILNSINLDYRVQNINSEKKAPNRDMTTMGFLKFINS